MIVTKLIEYLRQFPPHYLVELYSDIEIDGLEIIDPHIPSPTGPDRNVIEIP